MVLQEAVLQAFVMLGTFVEKARQVGSPLTILKAQNDSDHARQAGTIVPKDLLVQHPAPQARMHQVANSN